MNGMPFIVRNNVWYLLHEMREHPKLRWRFSWIDGICINQQNYAERNHQVKLMKQIYSTAAEVVIWLGSGTTQTDLAMDFISQQDVQPQRVKLSDHHGSPALITDGAVMPRKKFIFMVKSGSTCLTLPQILDSKWPLSQPSSQRRTRHPILVSLLRRMSLPTKSNPPIHSPTTES